jgi:hypothetical protein
MMRPLAGVRHAEGRAGTARGNAPQSGRIHPLRKTTLTVAAAALLAAPSLARADVLAGGPLFVGSSVPQQLAGCYVFNAGTTPVTLTSARIVGPNGQPIELITTSISCGPTLAAGQLCRFEGAVLSNVPYACSVTTPDGEGAFLRGSLQLGNAGATPAAATTPLLLTDTTGLGAEPAAAGKKSRRGRKLDPYRP